jgi:hypothetical protein
MVYMQNKYQIATEGKPFQYRYSSQGLYPTFVQKRYSPLLYMHSKDSPLGTGQGYT